MSDQLFDKRRLLARSKELKNKSGMERIYIVPDLTKFQQSNYKKLKEEVKALSRSCRNKNFER